MVRSSLTILVPVYNEVEETIQNTISQLTEVLTSIDQMEASILVVDDGSADPVTLDNFKGSDKVEVSIVRHNTNRGYGSALKTGVLNSKSDWIGIVDADGTYPIEDFASLCKHIGTSQMVVGARIGDIKEIPFARRFPKAMLNSLASYFAGSRINDLNSGMRIFNRKLAEFLWELLPPKFSFTSTLTMGALIGNYEITEVPINYYRRTGKSSIQPIKDTIRFFRILIRLGVMFAPNRIFGPVALVLLVAGVLKGFVRDYFLLGYIGNLSVLLILGGIQIAMMGLVADLIVHNRKLK